MNLQLLKVFALLLITSLLLISCHVTLIGAYDAITDEGIQQVQNDVSQLVVKIEKNMSDNVPAQNKYEVLKPDFEVIEGNVKSLQTRCDALPKYSIVKGQITTLADNIMLMEDFSKTSFTPQTLRIIDSTLQVQFRAIIVLQNGLKREKNNQ